MMCCTAALLLQSEEEFANQIGSYAYYLLVVGILSKLVQYLMMDMNKYLHEKEFKLVHGQT